jgi:hypothetical protein
MSIFMLRKQFSIRDSRTKSRFSFELPDIHPRHDLKRTPFRDPAALPMLQKIAEELRAEGHEVSKPKPGKACHGFCRARFPDVEIALVLLLRRRKGKIEFQLLTWPSQSLRQRLVGRTLASPDCKEWGELCSAIHSILARSSQLESLVSTTFSDDKSSG